MKVLQINLIRAPDPDEGTLPLRKPRKKSGKSHGRTKQPNVVWTSEATKKNIMRAHHNNLCLVCGLVLGEGETGARRMVVHAK